MFLLGFCPGAIFGCFWLGTGCTGAATATAGTTRFVEYISLLALLEIVIRIVIHDGCSSGI